MKLKLENRFASVFSISFVVLILLTSYQNCSRTALQSNYSDQKTSASNPSSLTNAVRDVNTNCVLTQISGPMIAVGADFYFQFTKQENQINPKYSCDNGANWSVLNLQNTLNQTMSGLSEGTYICKARVENSIGSLTNCLGQLSVQVVGADVVIPPSPAPSPTPNPVPAPTPTPQPNPSGSTNGLESLNDSTEMKLKKSEFQFITAPGYALTNFKEFYKPSSLYEIIPGKAYKLQFGNTNNSLLKLKYFVPPGAFRFNGRFLMSLSDQPAKGIWKKRFPPTTSASLVHSKISSSVSNSGGDWGDQVIINTMNNVEQFFYGEPRAGAMIISYGSSLPQSAQLLSGDYIYSEFNYQSGSNINFDLFWFVDKTCYDKWWLNPNVWDENNNPKEGYRHSCE